MMLYPALRLARSEAKHFPFSIFYLSFFIYLLRTLGGQDTTNGPMKNVKWKMENNSFTYVIDTLQSRHTAAARQRACSVALPANDKRQGRFG